MGHKVGVIPFQVTDDGIALLFVTSRRRGRWVLPKGGVEAGESHKKACKREAFEEAGIEGKVLTDFPVTVVIDRSERGGADQVPVTFYPMRVKQQADTWPESDLRDRRWVALADAGSVADHADYQQVIALFTALIPYVGSKKKQQQTTSGGADATGS